MGGSLDNQTFPRGCAPRESPLVPLLVILKVVFLEHPVHEEMLQDKQHKFYFIKYLTSSVQIHADVPGVPRDLPLDRENGHRK